MHGVALLLDVPEVLGLTTLIGKATLITVEHNIGLPDIYLLLRIVYAGTGGAQDCLRKVGERGDRLAAFKTARYLDNTLLPHPVGYEIGGTVNEQ